MITVYKTTVIYIPMHNYSNLWYFKNRLNFQVKTTSYFHVCIHFIYR